MIRLQFFAGGKTGLFPVHSNKFAIQTGTSETELVVIKGLESFSPSIDGNVEEFFLMEDEGWMSRMVTGKSLTITLSGKRLYGDPGNDYINGLLLQMGQECESNFEWTMASGATLKFACVINVTTPGGGDSTNVDTFECEILSKGKPVFTPATA